MAKSPSLLDSQIFHQLLAASVGGTIVALVVNPFDVVKTRLQAQVDPKRGSVTASSVSDATRRYAGSLDAVFKIVKYEGITSLWIGLRLSLLMAIPATAIYFTAYENLRTALEKRLSMESTQAAIIAGGSARLVSATFTCPMELIRTYFQAQQRAAVSVGIIDTVRGIVQKGGVMRLWAGLPPTLLRDAPFSAIYWSSYEWSKRHPIFAERDRASFAVTFPSGAFAGMLAAMLTTPIDVIKTRRQSLPCQYPTSIASIFKTIAKDEGLRGFWKGVLPRTAKVAPACAIMISSYELSKRFFERRTKQPQPTEEVCIGDVCN